MDTHKKAMTRGRSHRRYLATVFIGFGILVIVEGILSKDTLDLPLTLALYAFSFSVPILSLMWLVTSPFVKPLTRVRRILKQRGISAKDIKLIRKQYVWRREMKLFSTGSLLTGVGFFSLLWHIDPWAGISASFGSVMLYLFTNQTAGNEAFKQVLGMSIWELDSSSFRDAENTFQQSDD